MPQQSSIQDKAGYLLVTAKGQRDSFKAVIEGTKQINEAAKKHNIKFILADYRGVTYNVPLTDAVNLVKLYEHALPLFQEIVISAVTHYGNMEIARMWESICIQRGFKYKVFIDFNEAETWLKAQMH